MQVDLNCVLPGEYHAQVYLAKDAITAQYPILQGFYYSHVFLSLVCYVIRKCYDDYRVRYHTTFTLK